MNKVIRGEADERVAVKTPKKLSTVWPWPRPRSFSFASRRPHDALRPRSLSLSEPEEHSCLAPRRRRPHQDRLLGQYPSPKFWPLRALAALRIRPALALALFRSLASYDIVIILFITFCAIMAEFNDLSP